MGKPQAVYAKLRCMSPAVVGESADFSVYSYANRLRALFDGGRRLDHAAKDHRRTTGECRVEETTGEYGSFLSAQHANRMRAL